MTERNADIIIHGAGIAGLWTLARLRWLGYDAVLVEKNAIGGVQTIASQGIIHSGLKYALTGKINPLAQSISAMPEVWRAALRGEGPVDLSQAKIAAESQQLLIPRGIVGEAVKLAAKQLVGKEIEMPAVIRDAGFKGSVIHMGEPVLDIPSVVRVLAEAHKQYIVTPLPSFVIPAKAGIHGKESEISPVFPMDPGLRRGDDFGMEAKIHIHTAADGNPNSQIQKRPLLMGLMKHAPFPLWAHLAGGSEKPVATITTHTANDGALVWYVGGQVAERAKDSNPQDVYDAIRAAFAKYLPAVDLKHIEWAVLPIDRVEGRTTGFMPDAPVVHKDGNDIYAWPTKLTFAPLMADMIVEKLGITPSGKQPDWPAPPEIPYAQPPWNTAQWKSAN